MLRYHKIHEKKKTKNHTNNFLCHTIRMVSQNSTENSIISSGEKRQLQNGFAMKHLKYLYFVAMVFAILFEYIGCAT